MATDYSTSNLRRGDIARPGRDLNATVASIPTFHQGR